MRLNHFLIRKLIPQKLSAISRFRSRLSSQKGNALIMACIFLLAATTLITVGMKLVSNSSRSGHSQQLVAGEADNVARAGIQDALSWFIRKQSTALAYTTTFYPGQTPTYTAGVSFADQFTTPPSFNGSNSQKSDTMNASIGIVNEFPLDNQSPFVASFFGRYEVPIQFNPTPVVNAMHDVSGNRGVSLLNGDGQVWSVTSTGYVYQRKDYTYTGSYLQGTVPQWSVTYNQPPNKILAKAVVTSEFRKLGLNPPSIAPSVAEGAVYCSTTSQVSMSANSRLYGAVSATGNYAIVAMNKTGAACPTPTGGAAGNITPSGQPCTCFAPSESALLSSSSVFGMSLSDLQNIADYTGTQTNPVIITSPWKLTFYSGSVTYSTSSGQAPLTQLNSSGILVVNGDLTMNPNCCQYNGVIFVTGNLSVQDGDLLTGVVIMGSPYFHGSGTPGNLTMTGSTGVFSQIIYSPSMVTLANQKVAVYKEDLSQRQSDLTIPNW
jgi:hypothetical protein